MFKNEIRNNANQFPEIMGFDSKSMARNITSIMLRSNLISERLASAGGTRKNFVSQQQLWIERGKNLRKTEYLAATGQH